LQVDGDAVVGSINGGPLAGMRNAIINGNFDIWQRGTSFTIGLHGADRWFLSGAVSSCTMSRQAFTLGQTDVPGEPTYFARFSVTSVAGAAAQINPQQKIESVRTFAGQTVTISFWAKADASKNVALEFLQSFGSGGSPSVAVTSIGTVKKALTTSWQKITHTVSIPSISGKTIGSDNNDFLLFNIWLDAGSDFNARTDTLGQQSGTFDIAQVQIEAGPVATPFERRPQQTELALCQRYYEFSDNGNKSLFSGEVQSARVYQSNVGFAVYKRGAPSVVLANNSNNNFGTAVGSIPQVGPSGFQEQRTSNSTGRGLFVSTWTADAEL
jgi:hypothetical protein